MVVVLLVRILLKPLTAWIIGSGIRLADQRRPGIAVDGASGETPCPETGEVAEEFAAVV
jgi:hypothetical protein